MGRARLCTVLAAAAVTFGGCAAQEDSGGEELQGAEAEVAQVVEDLQSAAQQGDAEEICSRILAPQLASDLAAGSSQCVDEMEKAVGDVNDFDLEVTDVAISGTTARAQVEQGEDARRTAIELVRQGDGWRVTSLAG